MVCHLVAMVSNGKNDGQRAGPCNGLLFGLISGKDITRSLRMDFRPRSERVRPEGLLATDGPLGQYRPAVALITGPSQ